MALEFKIRDYRKPRKEIVKEVGIKPGFKVLDFGCGPGGYVAPVAEIVGENGLVYALDVLPIAIDMVKKLADKKSLKNVHTILSDCDTRLPNDSIDVVLLYDAFHDLNDQQAVLKELHRVLIPNGILSFSDHHMTQADITSKVTTQDLFQLSKKGKYTYKFTKTKMIPHIPETKNEV
jgi:ubiquinone/menaquinone biosynthesis C-methylase UbiE